MKRLLAIVLLAMSLSARAAEAPIALVIHGGAGISQKELPPEKEAACREVLVQAVRAGGDILRGGGSSLDAVQAAVVVLEDSPLFNAGRGAVLTAAGTVELDASIMDGRTGLAGAVAGVRGIKNPIRAARLVMEKTPHVLLIGQGAEDFAREQKVEFAPAEYFITPEQKERLEKAKRKAAGAHVTVDPALTIGTVGAVALDRAGHLAAATSTGGMTNKRPGRIGDSPIIGAGTYAADGVAAVSCTGHGEFFIRGVVAYDVLALMRYRGLSLDAATREIVQDKLPKLGGTGGLIAIDAEGRIATPFNTPGMFRAWLQPDGTAQTAIFEP